MTYKISIGTLLKDAHIEIYNDGKYYRMNLYTFQAEEAIKVLGLQEEGSDTATKNYKPKPNSHGEKKDRS